MSKFENKKAIVLGGTSGIGLATTEMLRDGGAEVIVGSRRECEIDGVECVQIDVLDREALSALFEKNHGFDYLVNAATGGARAIGPFLEMDLEGYQNSFAKLWGYVNSVRLGVPHMSAGWRSSIVQRLPGAQVALRHDCDRQCRRIGRSFHPPGCK